MSGSILTPSWFLVCTADCRLKRATGEFTPTMKLKRSVTEEQKLAVGVWAIVVKSGFHSVYPDSIQHDSNIGDVEGAHRSIVQLKPLGIEASWKTGRMPKPGPNLAHSELAEAGTREDAANYQGIQGAGAVVRAAPCDCSETRARQRKGQKRSTDSC